MNQSVLNLLESKVKLLASPSSQYAANNNSLTSDDSAAPYSTDASMHGYLPPAGAGGGAGAGAGSVPVEIQYMLLQSALDKQNMVPVNDSGNTGLSSALLAHVYSTYFNALVKQFSEYYSSLLQMQPDADAAKTEGPVLLPTAGRLSTAPEQDAATKILSPQLPPPSVASSSCSKEPFADDSVDSASHKGKQSNSYNDFQDGVTVGYTYDAFFVTDGRSRKRKHPSASVDVSAPEEPLPIHKRQLRYVCNECGKNYATSSNLSRHKQTHRSLNSKSAKKCPHCDKVYVSMPALSMHILTHDLKHKCDVCGKAFSRLWLLNGHKRIHSKEKPYGCAHCGKAFADRSNLRAHIQTHSQFKLYKCDFCGKSFALKSYLNKHYESSACCAAALGATAGQEAFANASESHDAATVCKSDTLSIAAQSDAEDKVSDTVSECEDDHSHSECAIDESQ